MPFLIVSHTHLQDDFVVGLNFVDAVDATQFQLVTKKLVGRVKKSLGEEKGGSGNPSLAPAPMAPAPSPSPVITVTPQGMGSSGLSANISTGSTKAKEADKKSKGKKGKENPTKFVISNPTDFKVCTCFTTSSPHVLLSARWPSGL